MSQIIEVKLKEMEDANWNTSSKGVIRSTVSAKEMISSAVKVSAPASLAWTGVSLVLGKFV